MAPATRPSLHIPPPSEFLEQIQFASPSEAGEMPQMTAASASDDTIPISAKIAQLEGEYKARLRALEWKLVNRSLLLTTINSFGGAFSSLSSALKIRNGPDVERYQAIGHLLMLLSLKARFDFSNHYHMEEKALKATVEEKEKLTMLQRRIDGLDLSIQELEGLVFRNDCFFVAFLIVFFGIVVPRFWRECTGS